MRNFYAGYNSYGTGFTYDSNGWSVHVFDSQAARDAWVNADDYPNGNPTREAVTLATARKIQPTRARWLKHSPNIRISDR